MKWLHLFFGLDGRISRKSYWLAACVIIILALLSTFFEFRFNDQRLGGLLNLALLYPDFAVMVKRAHDRDMSLGIVIACLVLGFILDTLSIFGFAGTNDEPSTLYWIFALPLIPIALYLFVVLGFFRGTHGPNRHGPDPLGVQT
jgi:uncharacterized membrane protein YhaH (DUF805 family)